MTDSWKSLEGVTLGDKFQLQSLVRADETTGCFLTRIAGPSEAWGWLHLAVGEDGNPDRPFQVWQTVAGLSHANLLQVRETGRTNRGVQAMAYLLTESADDSLASALDERALDQQEARDALLTTANVLNYLHARGLVYGRLAPSTILAVGDRIKLDCDAIQPIAAGHTPAHDLRQLGDCVYSMFTQQSKADLEHLSQVPQPFRDIVRGCYGEIPGEQWTARKVIDALNWIEPPVVAAVEPPPPAETEEPEPIALPPAVAARRKPAGIPAWVVVLACVTALLVVLLARRHSPPTAAATMPAAAASRIVTAPQPPPPSALGPRVNPPARQTTPEEGTGPRIWRVVTYTYSKAEDAAKMVSQINHKFPSLRAERFCPNGTSSPPYYVALGGRMTRTEAVRVRERAISSGLPRDTFVRNFR